MNLLNEILKKREYQPFGKIKDFSFKTYEESDYYALMNLFENVFPGYMSKDLWLWKNKNNPFGNLYTLLMKDGDNLISYYSIAPKEFYIYGTKYPCVQSMDTMTDLNYRGCGFSTLLGNLAYEYARRKGSYFVYGFPNNVSHYLFEKKLGWTNFGKRNLFIKNLSQNFQPLKNHNDYLIKEVKEFDENINNFWNECKNFYPIIIKKDKNYLQWRFVEHPFVKYKKFLIYNNNTSKIISYFVLKKFNDNKGNIIGHIVDFLIGSQDKIVKKKIFKIIDNYSINYFKEDCSKISFWLPDDDLKELIIITLGYHTILMDNYFGYKILNYTQQLDTLKMWKNWYITMANNDVF